MTWTSAISIDRLRRDGKAVAKLDGKQIALFAVGNDVFACNNRCPHEGYPLREGTLDDGCVLTCNWHGWKFDLRSGDNLLRGDRLRTYPTKIVEGAVWVDVADPPPEQRQSQAMANLRIAFDDHEYDRIAREVARLRKANADPVTAIAAAIGWSYDRLRFGTTHAYAAAPGWLALYDRTADAEARVVCLVEAIAYIAWDCLREAHYPFTDDSAPFDAAAFLESIEAQDEDKATALLRGALAAGRHFRDLEPTLTTAALRHYADFGHSLIYVVHTGRLIERLGERVETPLLLALVRSLTNASREDLIPEFRGYATALQNWPKAHGSQDSIIAVADLLDRSVEGTLAAVLQRASATSSEQLHRSLLGACAMNLLRYDTRFQEQTDNSIAENVSWLDFTHGITFGNAVRLQCRKFPELWPQALLQMACFVGRNSRFVDKGITPDATHLSRSNSFDRACLARIMDHGEPDYIHAAHLVKTYLAAREEIDAGLPDDIAEIVRSATDRYFTAPWKRKHARRTAHQAVDFVALED